MGHGNGEQAMSKDDQDEKEKDDVVRNSNEVTKLLNEWNAGDPDAMGKVAAELSGELRKLAASYMKGERENHTLQPTALVNELYLKLAQREQVAWTNRSHFFAFAARTLRRILVDHARKHRAEKRAAPRATSPWKTTSP